MKYYPGILRNIILQLHSVAALLLLAEASYGQQHNLRKFNIADGLPGSSVFRVVQDNRSYLWFATENGISRYDGTTFKNYTTKDGFPDYGGFHIQTDSKGRLWFLPFNGKVCYLENDKFKIPDFPKVAENDISWMIEDKKGNYWFGIRANSMKLGSVLMFDGKETHEFMTAGSVITLCELPDGNVIAYNLAGFHILNPLNKKIRQLPLYHDVVKVYYGRFLKLKDQSVLISTSEGIYKLGSDMRPRLAYPFIKNVFDGEVISMYEEENGDIWVGKQDGAWCFKGGRFDLKKAGYFLPGTIVNSILKDHEGNYWFTSPVGAFFLRSKSIVTYTTANGFNINEVSCVAKGANGELYIFLSNGYIYSLTKEGKLENLEHPAVKFQPVNFSRLSTAADGSIVLVANKFELTIKNNSTNYIWGDNFPLRYFDGKREWFKDQKGIGFVENGTLKYLYYTDTKKQHLGYLTSTICVDKDNNVWLGSKHGLYVFNGKEIVERKSENPLFGSNIVSMVRDSEGNIWVATKGNGVYTVRKGAIINFTSKDGLLTDYCNSLMIDEQDNLWISGNYGLNKVIIDKDKRIREIKVFNKSNSLLSNEVKSSFKDGNKVYVSTKEGLTILDETQVKSSEIPPPIYITGLKLGDKDTSLLGSYELDYGFGSMQIHYTGISYSPDRNISYRYKMLPLDTGWNYTSLASLEYSSLAPGHYDFQVSASNADGIWSTSPAELQFHIKTPFWQTWWFRILVLLTASLVILMIFYVRLQNSKNKSALKRKLIEAELMALRAQMNPHFIFNALNAIQDFILKNDKENANMYLSKFAGLIRVIMENSKRPFISLNDEIKFLNLYLEIESVRFNHKFSYHIEIDPEINRDKTRIPSMILQPYIENSIRHGLAAKTGKGKLLVKISAHNSQLKCIIEDDGIGRTVSLSAKKAFASSHISRGMETTSERLRLLNKESDLNMNVELIDLADRDGKPSGTKVLLTFPAESDY